MTTKDTAMSAIEELAGKLQIVRGTQFTPYENELVSEAADTLLALARQCEGMRRALVEAADLMEMSGYSTTEIRKALAALPEDAKCHR